MGKNRNKRQPRKQQARKKRRRQAATTNGMDFVKLFRWFLPNGRIFAGIKHHGNIKWLPVHLVALALLWSFSESRTLTDGFAEAVESSQKLFGSGFSVLTYQGFMGALVTWTPSYIPEWHFQG